VHTLVHRGATTVAIAQNCTEGCAMPCSTPTYRFVQSNAKTAKQTLPVKSCQHIQHSGGSAKVYNRRPGQYDIQYHWAYLAQCPSTALQPPPPLQLWQLCLSTLCTRTRRVRACHVGSTVESRLQPNRIPVLVPVFLELQPDFGGV
jgi:hypothetical protein